jgi:O-antigen/teichoic acid export membrane protein
MTAGTAPVVTAESRFGAKRLYRDASSIATSSVANAVLGMAFWVFAAKILPPERLGVMTAVLSVIVATGLVVATGIGDAYTALLPAVGPARPIVFRRGQRVFLTLALIAGVAAAIATTTMLAEVRGSVAVGVLVAVGTLVWAAFTLQNSTLSALGRASWLPAANIAASLGKIALVPVFVVTVGWHSVELAFVVSAAVLVLVLQPAILRVVDSGKDLPFENTIPPQRALREFDRLVVRTLTSVALSLGVLTVTPFLVTAFAGPSQGALFALSLSIVQTLDFIGAALGVSLVVHASSEPEQAAKMARDILIKTAALAALGAVLITAVAPVALRLLNQQYGDMGATTVIAVLSAGSVVRTVYIVWAALQRSRRQMGWLLAMNLITCALLLAVIPTLADRHGALGGAFALLVAQSVLSLGAGAHFIASRHRRKDTTAWPNIVGQGGPA